MPSPSSQLLQKCLKGLKEEAGREKGLFSKIRVICFLLIKIAPFCGRLPLSQPLGDGLTYIISFISYNLGTPKAPAHFTDEDMKARGV